MNDPDDPIREPEDWVLDLVRRHQDEAAHRVDPRPLFARIQSRMAPVSPASPEHAEAPTRHQPQRGWMGPIAALAAAVGLVLLCGWLLAPAPSLAGPSPRQLVEATQQVHRLPVDRCYLVETRRDAAFVEVFPNAPVMQTQRLWTRGDRFFLQPADGKIGRAWGRDENGTLWFAPTPRIGVRVESEEIPAPLIASLETHTLRVDQLLGEVLRNFDLVRVEESGGELPATEVIRATPTRGRFSPMLRGATLEIDPETKVIRRLVLTRGPIGKPVVTTTYTLVETTTLDAGWYSLEGHLREPYEILTQKNQPVRRQELLRRLYGPLADRWFGPR